MSKPKQFGIIATNAKYNGGLPTTGVRGDRGKFKYRSPLKRSQKPVSPLTPSQSPDVEIIEQSPGNFYSDAQLSPKFASISSPQQEESYPYHFRQNYQRKKEANDRLRNNEELNFFQSYKFEILELANAVKEVVQSTPETRDSSTRLLEGRYFSTRLFLADAITTILGKESVLRECLDKESELQEMRDELFSLGQVESRKTQDLKAKISSAENLLKKKTKEARDQIETIAKEYQQEFQPLGQALDVAEWMLFGGEFLAPNSREPVTFLEQNLGKKCFDIRESLISGFQKKEENFFGEKKAPNLAIETLVRNVAQQAAIKKHLNNQVRNLRSKMSELQKFDGGADKLKKILATKDYEEGSICRQVIKRINAKNEEEKYLAPSIIEEAFSSKNVGDFEKLFSEIDGEINSVSAELVVAIEDKKKTEEIKVRKINLVAAFAQVKEQYEEVVKTDAKKYLEDFFDSETEPTVAAALKELLRQGSRAEDVVSKYFKPNPENYQESIERANLLGGGIADAMEKITKAFSRLRMAINYEKDAISRKQKEIEEKKERLVANLKEVKEGLDEALGQGFRPDISKIISEKLASKDLVEAVINATFSGQYSPEEIVGNVFNAIEEEVDSYTKKQRLLEEIQGAINKSWDAIDAARSDVKPLISAKELAPIVQKRAPNPQETLKETSRNEENRKIEELVEKNETTIALLPTPVKLDKKLKTSRRRKSKLSSRTTLSWDDLIGEINFNYEVLNSEGIPLALTNEEKEELHQEAANLFRGVAADDLLLIRGKLAPLQETVKLSSSSAAASKKAKNLLLYVRPFVLKFCNGLDVTEGLVSTEETEVLSQPDFSSVDVREVSNLTFSSSPFQSPRTKPKNLGTIIKNSPIVAEVCVVGGATLSESQKSSFHQEAVELFEGVDPADELEIKTRLFSRASEKKSSLAEVEQTQSLLGYISPLIQQLRFSAEFEEDQLRAIFESREEILNSLMPSLSHTIGNLKFAKSQLETEEEFKELRAAIVEETASEIVLPVTEESHRKIFASVVQNLFLDLNLGVAEVEEYLQKQLILNACRTHFSEEDSSEAAKLQESFLKYFAAFSERAASLTDKKIKEIEEESELSPFYSPFAATNYRMLDELSYSESDLDLSPQQLFRGSSHLQLSLGDLNVRVLEEKSDYDLAWKAVLMVRERMNQLSSEEEKINVLKTCFGQELAEGGRQSEEVKILLKQGLKMTPEKQEENNTKTSKRIARLGDDISKLLLRAQQVVKTIDERSQSQDGQSLSGDYNTIVNWLESLNEKVASPVVPLSQKVQVDEDLEFARSVQSKLRELKEATKKTNKSANENKYDLHEFVVALSEAYRANNLDKVNYLGRSSMEEVDKKTLVRFLLGEEASKKSQLTEDENRKFDQDLQKLLSLVPKDERTRVALFKEHVYQRKLNGKAQETEENIRQEHHVTGGPSYRIKVRRNGDEKGPLQLVRTSERAKFG